MEPRVEKIDDEGDIYLSDLIKYIGNREKLASEKVAYIRVQRQISDSPVQKWFKNFIRKANAKPEEIGWGQMHAEELKDNAINQ